jgi:hypothetical protein
MSACVWRGVTLNFKIGEHLNKMQDILRTLEKWSYKTSGQYAVEFYIVSMSSMSHLQFCIRQRCDGCSTVRPAAYMIDTGMSKTVWTC